MASKLVLILDDLLWVLTDSQLKAMVQYAKSLSEAIEKSAEQRKSLASETAQVWELIVSLYHYQVFYSAIQCGQLCQFILGNVQLLIFIQLGVNHNFK